MYADSKASDNDVLCQKMRRAAGNINKNNCEFWQFYKKILGEAQ